MPVPEHGSVPLPPARERERGQGKGRGNPAAPSHPDASGRALVTAQGLQRVVLWLVAPLGAAGDATSMGTGRALSCCPLLCLASLPWELSSTQTLPHPRSPIWTMPHNCVQKIFLKLVLLNLRRGERRKR